MSAGPFRLGTHNHCMRRADSVHLRHRQFSLIGAAPSEDDVAFAEAEFGANDIATLAPAAALCKLPESRSSNPTYISSAASAGSTRSLTLSANCPNGIRFHSLRLSQAGNFLAITVH